MSSERMDESDEFLDEVVANLLAKTDQAAATALAKRLWNGRKEQPSNNEALLAFAILLAGLLDSLPTGEQQRRHLKVFTRMTANLMTTPRTH